MKDCSYEMDFMEMMKFLKDLDKYPSEANTKVKYLINGIVLGHKIQRNSTSDVTA